MFCRETTITAEGTFGGAAIPVKCRSWNCPLCVDMRQRQLMALAGAGNPNRFITITCRRTEAATPEAAATLLSAAWRTIVQRWRRLASWHKGEYLCVFEAHKTGWPHLHILWRGHFINWSWLKGQTQELLNSPHVHISLIKDAKSAVAYVAKYFGKAPVKFGTAKRYWKSGNYASSKLTDAQRVFPKTWKFEVQTRPIASIVADWQRWHRVIHEIPPDIKAWGALYEHERPQSLPPPKRFTYRGGILKYKTKEGITPIMESTVPF